LKGGKAVKGYTLYFRFENQCIEYPLQVMSDRQLEISLLKLGINGCMNIEVWDDTWVILENKYFNLFTLGRGGQAEQTTDAQISDNKIFYLVAKDNSLNLTVSAYETTQEFVNYGKFKTTGVTDVIIGSSANCHIVFNDRLVSAQHARIHIENGVSTLQDGQSKTGTFLNGVRITAPTQLQIFDEILIGNSKIVFLNNILAINNLGKNSVKLSPLTAFDVPDVTNTVVTTDTFSRSPRVLLPFDEEAVNIEAPPSKQNKDEMPAIFQYGPSITMPMPMIMSAVINMSVNGRGIKSYIGIMVSMLLSAGMGLMWSTLRRNYKTKKDAADEEFRVSQYTKYIQQNDEFIQEKVTYNSNILHSQYLATQQLLLSINDHREHIWNRNVNHQDFLTVYLGTGNFKSPFEIKVPEERFSLTQDSLLDYTHELKEKYEFVPDQPSILNINEHKIIGMLGNYDNVHSIACNIISQVAALHSYTDVKIVVLYREDEGYLYDWVRWLPHTFNKDKKLRFVANTPETREHVVQTVVKDLTNRMNAAQEGNGGEGRYPYSYVIVCTDPELFEGSTMIQCMTSTAGLGAHFILAYGQIDGIPNECKAIIECDENFSGFFKLDEARDETSAINFDTVPFALHEWFSRKISGLAIKEVASGEVPSMVDYLGSLGIGKLEQWDIRKKYKENRAYEGIKAFLGYGAGGKQMILDLHEKKYGPHGLVAGTTGSGKSETLQTAILSWMLNYSPEEVAFVLIDYKGGGMANAFLGEPHLAGTITNIPDDGETSANGESQEEESSESLDTNQTRRALVAIKAEIKYRQSVFRKYKVNHIDNYMRLYRKGQADAPLPHLIIISDEFAELKKEQPEFIKELVSAARVGRSLGVHLILATQKPGNSVDDEIWANSRFKICLRVQDTADSNGMLKRPEAAYLTQTGRAYFQLGNNEIFEEFQSAYSGADYIPRNKIELAEDSYCKMIELDGTNTPIEVEREQRSDDAKTQLEAGIEYVTGACRSLGIAPARQLWAPQLTKKMYLNQLPEYDNFAWDRGLYACIGLIDDPEMQTQHLATFNLLTTNNIFIVGTQGYGKTTQLYTFLYSLVEHYTPEQVQFYIMDYSSRMLKMFMNCKHCGDITNGDDELEKPQRLFQLIENEFDRRKQLYEDNEVGSYQEYLRIGSLPMILIVIDNVVMLNELYPTLEEKFIAFARDCVKYGVQFVVTGNKTNDLKTKIRTNFLDYSSINMEKSAYREIFGVSASFQPAPYRGRGMFLYNKRMLEYHTALPVEGNSELERNDTLVECLKQSCDIYASSKKAPCIPVIPKGERYSEFYEKANVNTQVLLPFGYDMSDISYKYIDIRTTYSLGFSSTPSAAEGVTWAMQNLIYAVKKAGHSYSYWQFDSTSKPLHMGVEKSRMFRGNEVLAGKIQEFIAELSKRAFDKRDKIAEDTDFDYFKYQFDKKGVNFIFIDNIAKFIQYAETSTDLLDAVANKKVKELSESKGVPLTEIEKSKLKTEAKRVTTDIITAMQFIEASGYIIIYGMDSDAQALSASRSALLKNLAKDKNIVHFGGDLGNQRWVESTAPSSEKRKIRPSNEGWGVDKTADIHYYIAEEL
jgi:S-DNA-T family DNA segregation ATPase FtsK/SpoIIIE